MILNADLTHHSYSILTSVWSPVRSRVRFNVPRVGRKTSYLTRRGRRFYPGTVPSVLMGRFGSFSRRHNLKWKTFTVWCNLFTQIFSRNENFCSVSCLMVHFFIEVIVKQVFWLVKFDNSTWFAFSLAIIFEVPVFRKMAAPASCHAVSRPKLWWHISATR